MKYCPILGCTGWVVSKPHVAQVYKKDKSKKVNNKQLK
jgi:hypothetical protein